MALYAASVAGLKIHVNPGTLLVLEYGCTGTNSHLNRETPRTLAASWARTPPRGFKGEERFFTTVTTKSLQQSPDHGASQGGTLVVDIVVSINVIHTTALRLHLLLASGFRARKTACGALFLVRL